VRLLDVIAARRHRQDPESGQATTEFALILIPVLIIVAGIIYFGIGLNYWLDMNRVANQGARSAAVNNWPAPCPRNPDPTDTSYACTTPAATCATALSAGSKTTLQRVLQCSTRNPNATTVTVCYPGKTPSTATVGDPVQVRITQPFTFFFMDRFGITLEAKATMRLEQKPTLITGALSPPGSVCP
jgi:Flp pilus assembly protein TadG